MIWYTKVGEKVKCFFNSLFSLTSNLYTDPLRNHQKTDKYDFVSREERHNTLELLKHKYPKFRRAYQIHKWIELWNTMNIQTEEYKNAFLRHFESAIEELDGDAE
jgi:hypothetical protein